MTATGICKPRDNIVAICQERQYQHNTAGKAMLQHGSNLWSDTQRHASQMSYVGNDTLTGNYIQARSEILNKVETLSNYWWSCLFQWCLNHVWHRTLQWVSITSHHCSLNNGNSTPWLIAPFWALKTSAQAWLLPLICRHLYSIMRMNSEYSIH